MKSPGGQVEPTAVSLFSGAGGLDIGLERAGFVIRLCVELDKDCRNTLKGSRCNWTIADPGDIHALTPEGAREQAGLDRGEVSVLCGGPPCQPFSKAAYWVRGETARIDDPRAGTLGAYLSFVKELLPETLLLENVRGLAYAGKDEGLQLLHRGLEQINAEEGTSYAPVVLHLNAASFGVPQLRERTFIVAHRGGSKLSAPVPTHADLSAAPYLQEQGIQPLLTAWDAIGDLDDSTHGPELEPTGKWADLLPSIPEGENYLWHTSRRGGEPLFGWRTRYWSFLLKLAKNRPSWTISAQPGPATGPFHWRNRRLSIRELARLQTFPDDYSIAGSYREALRQIGNAVPTALGEMMGLEIRRQLMGESLTVSPLSLLPRRREDCPPATFVEAVPKKYLSMRGVHAAHPGTGQGPSAQKRKRVAAQPS